MIGKKLRILLAEGSPGEAACGLRALYAETDIGPLLTELELELVGLAPVKRRIREIASLLLVTRARERMGFSSSPPTLHMAFTGNPGTGKTTVALRMAGLGWITPGRPLEIDPAADPARLDEYMSTIDPKTTAFTAALRRAAWPRRSP